MVEDYTAMYYQEQEKKFAMENKQKSANDAFVFAQKASDSSNKHYITFADKIVVISGATISASFTIYIALQNSFPDSFLFDFMLFYFRISLLISLVFGVLSRHQYAIHYFDLSRKSTWIGYKERQEAVLIVEDNVANLSEEEKIEMHKNVADFSEAIEQQQKICNKSLGTFWRYYQTSLRSFIVACCLIVVIISLLTILKDTNIPHRFN